MPTKVELAPVATFQISALSMNGAWCWSPRQQAHANIGCPRLPLQTRAEITGEGLDESPSNRPLGLMTVQSTYRDQVAVDTIERRLVVVANCCANNINQRNNRLANRYWVSDGNDYVSWLIKASESLRASALWHSPNRQASSSSLRLRWQSWWMLRD